MNLWNFLKQNNNDIPQIDAVILDDPSRPELTQELKQRAANNDVKDRSNRFTNLFNKIADIDNINEPIETPSIKIGNFYNDKISPMKEKFVSGLFGKLVNPSIENENNVEYDNYGNTQLNTAIGTPRKTGGFFNDFANGAKENYNNGFQISNLLNDFGKNKGVGYRLGEGLGTIGRIAQSPLGRAAITAGLVGLTGGSALQALTFGGMAGAGNQYNILRDKMYRNELLNQGIDTSNLKGYVNDNTFNKVLEAKQLQDNAEFKRMYYEAQQQQARDNLEFRKQQAAYQREQDRIDNALKSRGLDIQEQKARQSQIKQNKNLEKNNVFLKQIKQLENALTNTPTATGFVKGSLAKNKYDWAKNLINDRSTDEEIGVRGKISDLRSATLTSRTGTAQTAIEMANLAPFLPDVTDSNRVALAKLKSLKEKVIAETNAYKDTFGIYDDNPADKLYENQNRTPKLAY